MPSLRAEHGGVLGNLLLVYAIHIFYKDINFPLTMTVHIDNKEAIRRGQTKVQKLGVNQQFVFDYSLWVIT